MALKLKTPAAAAGWRWTAEGWRLFRQQPMGFASLFVCFMVGAQILAFVPVMGGILAMMAVPLMGLAYMMAGEQASRGGPAQPQIYAVPWRLGQAIRVRLVSLCVVYAGANLLLLWGLDLADSGRFEQSIQALSAASATEKGITPEMLGPELMMDMGLRMGLTTLLGLPFWHAPALVVWAGQSVAQALFSTSVALWRARAAYLNFGLSWLTVLLGLSAVLAALSLILGDTVLVVLVMPAGLAVMATLQTALYATYRDCFTAD